MGNYRKLETLLEKLRLVLEQTTAAMVFPKGVHFPLVAIEPPEGDEMGVYVGTPIFFPRDPTRPQELPSMLPLSFPRMTTTDQAAPEYGTGRGIPPWVRRQEQLGGTGEPYPGLGLTAISYALRPVKAALEDNEWDHDDGGWENL